MKSFSLYRPLPDALGGEVVDLLLRGGDFRLERIVSRGQTTRPGQWYDQDTPEWVVLLAGSARLRFEDQMAECVLQPGDVVHIEAHRRHRVSWTDPQQPTIWLAVHYRATDETSR